MATVRKPSGHRREPGGGGVVEVAPEPAARANRSADSIGFEILRSLRTILRHVSLHSRDLWRQVGLTVPQLLCLKAIAETDVDSTTVGAISHRVSLSQATVSRIIERLVREGLVERHRWESDRRKVFVRLTAAGRERYDRLPAPLDERFLERLDEMPEPQRLELLAALNGILALMGAETGDAAPILMDGVGADEERPR